MSKLIKTLVLSGVLYLASNMSPVIAEELPKKQIKPLYESSLSVENSQQHYINKLIVSSCESRPDIIVATERDKKITCNVIAKNEIEYLSDYFPQWNEMSEEEREPFMSQYYPELPLNSDPRIIVENYYFQINLEPNDDETPNEIGYEVNLWSNGVKGDDYKEIGGRKFIENNIVNGNGRIKELSGIVEFSGTPKEYVTKTIISSDRNESEIINLDLLDNGYVSVFSGPFETVYSNEDQTLIKLGRGWNTIDKFIELNSEFSEEQIYEEIEDFACKKGYRL